MQKKANLKKDAGKNAKKAVEETPKAHGPDVKRLLEEYEQKADELVDEDELVSQHMDMDKEEQF